MPSPIRPRKLGLAMATALVMGNMIGSGVFLLPAKLAPFGWNGVIAWVLTTAGALTLAVLIGRLARTVPGGGGPIGAVEHAFGPAIATLIGWSAWISWWTAAAAVAIAAVSYLSVFVPTFASAPGLAAAAAIALIWLLTLLNLRGARAAGGFQLLTTVLKLMPLVVTIVILGVLAAQNTVRIAPLQLSALSVGAVTTSATLTLWALVGFESAGLASDKLDRPEVNVARSTVFGTALTGIVYILVCSGLVLTLPVASLTASNAPFALFIETYWSHEAALAVAAFAAISAIGALNGFVLIQAEIPLSMARAGLLPSWFGRADAMGTPVRMLIVSSLLASLLVLFNSSKSLGDLFQFMALLSTSATLWLYLALSLAALRLHAAGSIAVIGAAYALWALWGAGINESGLSLCLMLTALPLYAWHVRRRAVALPA